MKQKRNPLTWRWNLFGDKESTGPLKILIVDQLPPTWEEWVIYIVQGALYSTMYVRDPEHNVFVKVGTTQVTTQEQADWLEDDETAVSYIKNKPILAEVAITGSYDSLIDTPEIPEVFDTVITFKKNGEIVWTISTNQEEESEIDFEIPTKTSDLENDVPFITEADIPEVPTKLSELENDTGFINKYVNNLEYYTKTEDLAPVALSNDYDDLDNKPTIPTKLSDLENDTWFIDNTTNNLLNYRNKTNSYSKTQIDELLAWLSSLRIEIVTELPNPGEFWVIYLIEIPDSQGAYRQYVLIESPDNYAMIGRTSVDLTNYFNKVTDTTDNITQWDTNLFMTEAEKINLSHQSWYNTGDETKITILEKMWPASATNDGYLKKEDRRDFDAKVDYDDFIRVPVTGWTININDYSTETTTSWNVTVNTGSRVKSGLVYLLKVNASGTTKLILWSWVTNPADVDLTVIAWHTKLFVLLANSNTSLEFQGYDLTDFVKTSQLAQVAFTGNYNDLSNKPSIPTPVVPGNWRLRIRQDGAYVADFYANQSGNTTVDITTGIFTWNQVFSRIADFSGQKRLNHWLWKTPKFIDIDWYVNYGQDSQGRNTASRVMISWTPDGTDFLGTIFHFSDGTTPGTPTNMDSNPITVQATDSQIILTPVNNRYCKVRVTAYL